MKANQLKIIDKKLGDYNIHWLIITIKLVLIFLAFACNVSIRKLICPLVCAY